MPVVNIPRLKTFAPYYFFFKDTKIWAVFLALTALFHFYTVLYGRVKLVTLGTLVTVLSPMVALLGMLVGTPVI